MRRYETREVTRQREEFLGAFCDGCGGRDDYYLIAVAIEVNHGEEGGSRDEYDYCDACLLNRTPALVAAGSRSRLVLPEEPEGSGTPT